MPRDRRAHVVAFIWGLAEASLFFIVPDVWLSWVSARSVKSGLRACAWTLAGALLGGFVMYTIARVTPAAAEVALTHVPGIHAESIAIARAQIVNGGLTAVLGGPIQGRPYKIYAVEWAANGGAVFPFLLVSIPARVPRFLLSIVAGRLFGWALSRWTRDEPGRQSVALISAWVVFYLGYFLKVGW